MTAPVHKCRSIKTWLDKFGVEQLGPHSQRPDLRPSHPTSVADLTNALLDEWKYISIENLVELLRGETNSILKSL